MAFVGRIKWIHTLGYVVLAGLLCFGSAVAQAPAETEETVVAAEEVTEEIAGELTDTLGMTDTLGEGEMSDTLAAGTGFADLEEESGILDRMAKSGFVDLFHKGGRFMWALLLLTVVGLAVILERFYTIFKSRTNVRRLTAQIGEALRKDGVDGAMQVCQRTRGPIASILHAGLMKAERGPEEIEKAIQSAGTVEMSYLERGLVVISSVSTIGPLLGFLGTASGMISAFETIAAAEQVNAKLVAGGISEALITTAAGLAIAIPAQAAHNFFVAQVDRFIIEMEQSSTEMIDTLIELEGK